MSIYTENDIESHTNIRNINLQYDTHPKHQFSCPKDNFSKHPFIYNIFVNTSLFLFAIQFCSLRFMCYNHVGDLMSMRSSPSILCYQGGDHTSMMIISVIASLSWKGGLTGSTLLPLIHLSKQMSQRN